MRLKSAIGDDQYSLSYTKKAQMTSYFGFMEWEDIENPRSIRRITKSGRLMYEALISDDTEAIEEIFKNICSQITKATDNDRVKGRKNVLIYGVPGLGKSYFIDEN